SAEELAALQELARAVGRPISFSAILDLPDRADAWAPVFTQLRAASEGGPQVVPQVSCRPMRFDFDLETGCASLDALPCWRRFRPAGSAADRRALLDDAEFRAAFRCETLGRPESPSSRRWASAVLELASDPRHVGFVGRSLADIAAARG